MPTQAEVNVRLAELLQTQEEDLLTDWSELAAPTVIGRMTSAELRAELKALYGSLVDGLETASTLDSSDQSFSTLRANLEELSFSRARQGFSPSETAVSVFSLKEAVLKILDGATGIDLFETFVAFSRLVDQMGLLTFDIYLRARESTITEQAEQLLELSTPVVTLSQGILAVPLVGTLDSARTQVFMEKLLQGLVDTGSTHAIIDITGVPAVDTQVAQHLLKTIVAARLMGADCILSGIRPQIAQTIVNLGIEFGDIVTKAKLGDALLLALEQTGKTIVDIDQGE